VGRAARHDQLIAIDERLLDSEVCSVTLTRNDELRVELARDFGPTRDRR
jgi:hypothetical protein